MNEETLNLQKALVEALLDKRALDVVSETPFSKVILHLLFL